MEICSLISSLMTFVISKGNQISFWNDVWLGESSLSSRYPKLSRITSNRNAFISEIISSSEFGISWNLSFSRDLHSFESNSLSSLKGEV